MPSYCRHHHHKEPPDDQHAVVATHLVARYPGVTQPALADVSLSVPSGRRVALVGSNGAGKSTLLKAIAGLQPIASGSVKLFGLPISACHHRVAYLPQRGDLDWSFPIDVRRLIGSGRYVHLGWFRRPKSADRDRVQAAMKTLRIDDLASRQIGELSGGQQQRVLLARALVQDAALLLLDEPTTAIDQRTREIIADVLTQLTDQQRTVVVATHDVGRFDETYDQIIYLRDGRRIDAPDDLAAAGSHRADNGPCSGDAACTHG